MKRLVLLALLVALFLPVSSGAAVRPGTAAVVVEDGAPGLPYQRWVNRSRVRTLMRPVVVSSGSALVNGRPLCSPDLPMCALLPDHIGVTDPTDSPRFTFLHEFGHLYDHRALTPAQRTRFIAILRLPAGTAWESPPSSCPPGVPASDPACSRLLHTTPLEAFAQSYAVCALYGVDRVLASRWSVESGAWVLHRRQLAQTCGLIGPA